MLLSILLSYNYKIETTVKNMVHMQFNAIIQLQISELMLEILF